METSRSPRAVSALIAAIAGVAVLTAFAAWSPPSFRKLVLFSVAYGLCVGGIVVWSAREFGMKRLSAVTISVALTVTGLGLIALRGCQQYQSEQSAAEKTGSEQAMARSLLEAAAASDPQLAEQLAAERDAMRISFADYLALRVKPLGEWRQPWSMVFWGTEVLLATACGAFLVSRQLRSSVEATEGRT